MSVNENFNKWISQYLGTSKDISPSKVEVIKRIMVYDDVIIRKIYESLISGERDEKINDILS